MKKLLLSLLLSTLLATAHAAVITFQGVINEVRPPSEFHAGDVVIFTFVYNPHSNVITWFDVRVGNVSFGGRHLGGFIAVNSNPASGSVYYQVVALDSVVITLQAATPLGVIPPIEQFNLNDFAIFSDAFGYLTSLPRIKGP